MSRSFLSVDLSQIEMRILAHISQDEALLSVFNSGGDVHAETAAKMFSLPLSQVDEEKHRRPAKAVGFGVVYGMTESGLLDRLKEEMPDVDWKLSQSTLFLSSYFETHPGVTAYMNDTKTFARRYGYVVDMWGRRRNIPEVASSRPTIVEAGLRQAINFPIQASAAGMIKTHMRVLDEVFQVNGWSDDAPLLMQIHDDLVFEVKDDILPEVVNTVIDVMQTVVKLSVPVLATAKVGKSWGSIKKYPSKPLDN